jgi:hypothetical protein
MGIGGIQWDLTGFHWGITKNMMIWDIPGHE